MESVKTQKRILNYVEFLKYKSEAQDKLVASKIFDETTKLTNNFENSKKRPIWELMQNAKDVAYKKSLKIEIEISKKSLIFKHSGKPFLLKHLVYLIQQTSSKDRQEKLLNEKGEIDLKKTKLSTTGKYGTGFMTTHIYAKKIKLKGIFYNKNYNTYQKFEFFLDRSADSIEEMIFNINNTFEIFKKLDDFNVCPIIENYKIGENCDTVFEYEFEREDICDVAVSSIKDLENTLPYVFCFIKDLNEVKIFNKIENSETVFKRTFKKDFGNDIILQTVEKNYKNEKNLTSIFYLEGDFITLARELKRNNDKDLENINNYYIEEKDKNTPTFFIDFPLIESEKFIFPFIIQSHLLEPDEKRSTILIDHGQGEQNKIILEKIPDLYKKLFLFFEKLTGIQFLLNIGSENNWFLNNIEKNLGRFLLNKKVFNVFNGKKNSFDNVILYDYENKSFQLTKIMGGFLPEETLKCENEKDFIFWKNIVSKKWWDFVFQGPNKIFQLISDTNNLDNLIKIFKNEDKVFEFLNEIYSIFLLYENKLFQKKIFPNKNGNLKKFQIISQLGLFRNEKEYILFEDKKIPIILKNISKQYCNYDIDNILIHNKILVKWNSETKNMLDIIEIINNKVNSRNMDLIIELSRIISPSHLKERNNILKLIEIFYQKEKIEIEYIREDLWKISDNKLIKNFVKIIERQINFENLENKIGNKEKTLEFLKIIFNFKYKFFPDKYPIIYNLSEFKWKIF